MKKQTKPAMKHTYERPEAEYLPVTVTNFFCTNPSSGPTSSDQGMQSYSYGGEWGDGV